MADTGWVVVMGSLVPPQTDEGLRVVLRQLSSTVRQALQDRSCKVRFLEASSCDLTPEAALAGARALIVLGGADCDPAAYGQEAQSCANYGINPRADRFELAVMRAAVAQGLPTLGICRGMQLINVLYGGDLLQDIGSGGLHSGSGDNALMVTHAVDILPDTHLARLYGAGALDIRSGHHQAVGRLGQGLRIAARAADGVIEAIEAQGAGIVIGVQWHPEEATAPNAHLDQLIGALL